MRYSYFFYYGGDTELRKQKHIEKFLKLTEYLLLEKSVVTKNKIFISLCIGFVKYADGTS